MYVANQLSDHIYNNTSIYNIMKPKYLVSNSPVYRCLMPVWYQRDPHMGAQSRV